MRRCSLLWVLFLLPGTVFGRNKDSTELTYMKGVVYALAHDSMKGRSAGSIQEGMAADFLIREINAQEQGVAKIQRFVYALEGSRNRVSSQNVFCFIDHHAASTILLGAHFDHIGLGERHSLSYNKRGHVHNGADDNASGVAILLALYKSIASWGNKEFNYLFVWYSAHEDGLYGSQAFKPLASSGFGELSLVINFDMVGRLDPHMNLLTMYGCESLGDKQSFLRSRPGPLQTICDQEVSVFQTDAGAFARDSIPSISFTTGTHDDYHKVTDDSDTLNYEGMLLILEYLQFFLKLF